MDSRATYTAALAAAPDPLWCRTAPEAASSRAYGAPDIARLVARWPALLFSSR